MEREFPPASHSTDPSTSHEAESRHAPKRRTNLRVVVQAVANKPGRTAAEIAYSTGMDVVEVRRRLSDAQNQYRVRRGVPRICHVAGNRQSTWWPAP